MWITGIPAAGKTALALGVREELAARGQAAICIDGDDLRATVSGDLGFDRDSRRENAQRASALAQESARRGETAIVSLVSPYRADRDAARAAVGEMGAGFVEVFVDTPAGECRRRDPKGLYAAAARGRIRDLTGWDAPYEPPSAAEVHIAPGAGEIATPLERSVALVLAALT